MIEAIIWFLLGYVSGGVAGMLIFALITANDQKKGHRPQKETPRGGILVTAACGGLSATVWTRIVLGGLSDA